MPQIPTGTALESETDSAYDDQGRVYASTVYDITGGAAPTSSTPSLVTKSFFNHDGQTMATYLPGGLASKQSFNGAGWVTASYQSDGGGTNHGGTPLIDYTHAGNVGSDLVLSESDISYDSDGNAIFTINKDRFHDDASTATDALGDPSTSPKSRNSYSGAWFDLADRVTATEDAGTNGGTAWPRLTTLLSGPDTRSDTALVTSYGYLADNIQTVVVTGGPTGGTFTLSFNGHNTGTIAYNASAATVQSALAGLTGVGAGNVAVTSPAPWTYSVRFMGSLAGAYQPPIALGTNSLSGGTLPTVVASETTPGGNAGAAHSVTDPRGLVSLIDLDLLGRTTATVADLSTGVPSASADQVTAFQYDGNGDTTGQTALMPAGTPNQTTAYVFGVTTTGGSTITSNDLLAKIQYPDPSTGAASTATSGQETFAYDDTGETTATTDRNSTAHALAYDVLGRESTDTATVATGNPQSVDEGILRLGFNYNNLGLPYQLTSYADAAGTIIANQVQDQYNGFGELTGRYQSDSGAVNTSTTPQTQWSYTETSTANNARPLTETYPGTPTSPGRIVHLGYDGSTLDSAISRIDYVADDNGSGGSGVHLADYQYLGLSTIVNQADGNGNALSYIQQSNDSSAITTGSRYGGDQYTGLDRFGRVVDRNYVQTYTSTPTTAPTSSDRFQYAIDRDGNVLSRNNLVSPANSELYLPNATSGTPAPDYDGLNRLTTFQRGTLSSSGLNGSALDTVSTPSKSQSWTLDTLGNWSNFSSTTSAGTAGQTRTADAQNRISLVTPSGTSTQSTPSYDNAGDTTADGNGATFVFDPWRRLTGETNSGTNHGTLYGYSADGDRVTQQDATRTDGGPILVVNNGSAQRSMVDSLTVVFPAAVTLTSTGAFTLTNTTTSTTVTTTYSNPSGDGKTFLISFSGTGNSLADGVYNLTLTYADITAGASTSGISADRTWGFHRLFGDLNGNATVASTDPSDNTAFSAAYGTSTGSPLYEPAFDYDHNGIINSIDYAQFRNRYNANSGAGTTYSYTNASPILAGASTTAPVGQTDISAWAASNALNTYNDSAGRVIEERPAGATGASKQFVWGLSYVNDLLEQDTATAADSGGNLPTTHLLTYALDPSFNSTGTLVGPAGSYDGVAIQPADSKIVVAGVSGTSLLITRYYANGTADTSFGTAGTGTVTLSETSPTFCRLALDASGNIVVAVDKGGTGGPVQVSRLTPSGTLDTTFNSTGQATITFATGVVPQGIAIQSDGKIDVVADSTGGAGIYLARLTTAGVLDTAFGSSGEINAPLSGAPSGLSIALDPAGKILVGGSDGGDISVVRFTSAGALDTTFNTTGEAKANFGATDAAYAVSPGPNGTVVAAGYSNSSGTYNHAIARWTSSGSLDTTFGSSGEVLGTGGTGVIRAMLVEPNGSILAGGDANGTAAQKVWKFLANGTADSEFNTGGSITANSGATVYGWAITSGPTQRVVVAGSYNGNAALAAFAPASLRLYAQSDANYDTTALADANGTVQERAIYDPYGAVTFLSAQWQPASDSFGVEYLFQGMRYDPATGLYHTPNREYTTSLGRWMQQDGGSWDGANLYQALRSSPLGGDDPLGLWKIDRHESNGRAQALPQPSDTIRTLAHHVKLNAEESNKWLLIKLRNGGTDMARNLDQPVDLNRDCSYWVPNVAAIYLGNNMDTAMHEFKAFVGHLIPNLESLFDERYQNDVESARAHGFQVWSDHAATDKVITDALKDGTSTGREVLYKFEYFGHGTDGIINSDENPPQGVGPGRYTYYGIAEMGLYACESMESSPVNIPYTNEDGGTGNVDRHLAPIQNVVWRVNVSRDGMLIGYYRKGGTNILTENSDLLHLHGLYSPSYPMHP